MLLQIDIEEVKAGEFFVCHRLSVV
jgi:hypothetical protein